MCKENRQSAGFARPTPPAPRDGHALPALIAMLSLALSIAVVAPALTVTAVRAAQLF